MRFAFLALVIASTACNGVVGTLNDSGNRRDGSVSMDSGGTLPDGAPRPDTGTPPTDTGTPPTDTGTPDTAAPPFDAGACGTTTLAASLSVTAISGTSTAGRVFAAPTAANGAVIAMRGSSGVDLLTVAGDGTPAGSAVVITGSQPYGIAVGGGTTGVLVNRGSDALYLVGIGGGGATVFDELLIGEVDHGVTENEWFGSGIRAGRLTWTGTQWAAYYTVQRLWSDGVAHYGDQLRLLNADGAAARTVWGWGCSHSMEVRIAHDGTNLGPLCASDCFPEPGGVHFNHRTFLYSDERANCSGGHTAHLGGMAPVGAGFLAVFTVGDSRSSEDVAIVRIDGRTPGAVSFLTADSAADSAPNVTPYDVGAVVGWVSGGSSRLLRVGADGTPIGTAEDVPAADLANASDFFQFSNGDAGWVINSGGSLSLARLRDCD